ncbi:MAG: type II toxin-antitoxin system YoeB family toxin [Prevotellaceae bacterium]|jgi:toxin YoeB|nr:type II toxin-antitoxin system YoeB family toxin [Prevotellaceae bacterium]
MYKFKESKTAIKDWDNLKSMTKAVKAKFRFMFEEILENPRTLNAVGSPEQLKHQKYETYSRELDKKDRIVFEIRSGAEFDMPEEEEIVVFLQYLGHYTDK